MINLYQPALTTLYGKTVSSTGKKVLKTCPYNGNIQMS